MQSSSGCADGLSSAQLQHQAASRVCPPKHCPFFNSDCENLVLTIGDKCQDSWLSHEKPFGVFCANTKPTLYSPSVVQPRSKVLLVASALKINPLWSKNDIRRGFENAAICLWIFQRTAGGFLRGEGGCFGPAPGCFRGLNPVSDWKPSSGPWVQPNWALDLYGDAKVPKIALPTCHCCWAPQSPAGIHLTPSRNFSVILQNLQNVCNQLGSHYRIIYHYGDTATN